MKLDKTSFRLHQAGMLLPVALGIGGLGLAASVVGFVNDRPQFFHSYLTAFAFWLTLALGALFFTMCHHLTRTRWAVVLRRLFEAVMMPLPWLVLLALPIVFLGLEPLYGAWAAPAADLSPTLHHLLEAKSWWLSPGKFQMRQLLYFAVWAALAVLLHRASVKQDQQGHSAGLDSRFRVISGPGMLLFALTVTGASFDLLMSLNPYWYSTIFGIYIFTGGLLANFAFLGLVAFLLRSRGVLKDEVTVEHYHDIGKLVFAFTFFWAYIAFSQFLLIWYGNIPEETEFFYHRWYEGNWREFSLLLLFGHFVLPFLALVSRIPKRRPALLAALCAWMLAMHYVDLYWIIMPNLHQHGVHLHWLDASTFVGVGGVFVAIFWQTFQSQPVLPVKDPHLAESLAFQNT